MDQLNGGKPKRYYRKSLQTRNQEKANNLGIEEFFKIRQKIEAGETLSRMTTRQAADEYLSYQKDRVRRTGQHEGRITQGRYEAIRVVVNVHVVPFIGPQTKVDEVKGSMFSTYFTDRWKHSPEVRKSTLGNERSVISNMFGWMGIR